MRVRATREHPYFGVWGAEDIYYLQNNEKAKLCRLHALDGKMSEVSYKLVLAPLWTRFVGTGQLLPLVKLLHETT